MNNLDESVHMINYLINNWHFKPEHRVLGFIKVDDKREYLPGICINDECFCCFHVFRSDQPIENESDKIVREKPYVLMLYGTDNASYFQRYKTMNKAIEIFNSFNTMFSWSSMWMKSAYFYNS